MSHKEVLEALENDKNLNEGFFIYARSHFLQDFKKGILILSIQDPEKFLEYISNSNLNIDMCYETNEKFIEKYKDYINKYNPNKQFLILLETKNKEEKWETTVAIVNKLSKRHIFFNKILSLSGNIENEDDIILNMPCFLCKNVARVKLPSNIYKLAVCTCCKKNVNIAKIYECKRCMSQFIYSDENYDE